VLEYLDLLPTEEFFLNIPQSLFGMLLHSNSMSGVNKNLIFYVAQDITHLLCDMITNEVLYFLPVIEISFHWLILERIDKHAKHFGSMDDT
jgi:hypothetical protein